MRLLKMLLLGTVLMSVVAGVVGLVVTEGWLFWGAKQLASDFYRLKELGRREMTTYTQQCQEVMIGKSFGETEVKNILTTYQLRFIDDQSYVIEVVCPSEYVEPVFIFRGRLLQGVRKVRGSGIVYAYDPKLDQDLPVTGLVIIKGLGLGQRQVGMIGGKIFNSRQILVDEATMAADAPKTTCEGFSGKCCVQGVDQGLDLQLNSSDCPGNCYYACVSRPSVVYLKTTPALDQGDRKLEIFGNKAEVKFGYKVADTDGYVKTAELDFGDGQKYIKQGLERLENKSQINHELTDEFAHTYICREKQCQYRAVLTAMDESGNGVIDSRLNEIVIYQWTE